MRIFRVVLALFLLLGGLFFLGPRVDYKTIEVEIPTISADLAELDDIIDRKESEVEYLKPENQARIVWADSIRKTPWSIVYIHGFSASPMEGNPVHFEVARKFGMNLYLARVYDHGISSKEAFLELSPQNMMESAVEALAIGRMLGEKVLLMSCSTGGTLSIYLAAHFPDLIDGMVMYSPNIKIANPMAKALTGPWGLQIATSLEGKYRVIHENIGTEKEKYASVVYRVEGLAALQSLLDQTMIPDVFNEVQAPFFMGYYYKNEHEQDPVVSVQAMQDFYEQTSTPSSQKKKLAFPEAGNHVICSDLHSGSIKEVIDETSIFMTEVLNINVIPSQ